MDTKVELVLSSHKPTDWKLRHGLQSCIVLVDRHMINRLMGAFHGQLELHCLLRWVVFRVVLGHNDCALLCK